MQPLVRRSAYRHFPLTSEQIGPPRRELSHRAYAQRFGARLVALEDEERPRRQQPLYVGDGCETFLSRVEPVLPATAVLSVRDARVIGPDGWVVAPGDVFLSDASWYRGDTRECAIHDIARAKAARTLRGVSISLASDWAYTNYCHFLLEALPRIAQLESAAVRWADCDHILLPDLGSRTAQEMIDRLAIPREKTIALSTLGTVRCEELIVPCFPGMRRNVARRQVRFVRERLTPEAGAPWRRIYVHRGAATRRSITNEAEALRLLERHGFEVYAPGRGLEDLRVFAEAAVVVGAHGAALANTAACRPGTIVAEILPHGFLYPYYYTTADSADCRYGCVVGEPGARDPRNDDFMVDVAKLERVLDELLASK